MTAILCTVYAHAVAAVWAGLGWDMIAVGGRIACAEGCAEITPGCLALRAVCLSGWAGVAAAALTGRPLLFPLALLAGLAMSLLRSFILVGLVFRWPALFNALHAQCGWAVFSASVALVAVAALKGKTVF